MAKTELAANIANFTLVDYARQQANELITPEDLQQAAEQAEADALQHQAELAGDAGSLALLYS